MIARRLKGHVLVLASLLIAACHVGPEIEYSNLGRDPKGASVQVQLTTKTGGKRTKHRGELLEVRDDALVVVVPEPTAAGARLVRIPWNLIYRVKAVDLPGIAVRTSQGDAKRADSTDKLRIVSRFPQGLTAEQSDQLLAHYGQSAMVTIE